MDTDSRSESVLELATARQDVASEAQDTRLEEMETTSALQSIVILLASFTLIFTACGLNFAFGIYQSLYEEMSQSPDTPFSGASPAEIDLIGTLSISLMTIGAPFASGWTKRYPPSLVVGSGGVIFGLGSVLASYSTKLWQFELTQGVLLGVATCLTYMPPVTVAPTWFNARRGLAMGIILSGGGVGGVAWAPALRALHDTVGFRNSLRITGAISSVLIILSERLSSNTSGGLFQVPLINWRVAKSKVFLASAIGASLQAAAYYTPVFFFSSYAKTLGYSDATGANFIAISNACNAIGKIAIGYLADRTGRLNALFLTTFLSAVTAFALWLPSSLMDGTGSSRGLFIAFSILYGVFASAYVSLFPTSLVELFGIQHFASVNGVLYMARGLATLVGTPVAGALIRSKGQTTPISYEKTTILVGVLLAGAALSVFWMRIEAMLRSHSKKWNL